MAEQRLQRRLAAILAVDVVGYSRLMEMNEVETLARLKALRKEIFNPTIDRHAGRVVKLMGDGALVEFGSAVDAVACAIAIQNSIRERNARGSEEGRIEFRIGINVGDIMVDGDDIYGDGVNVAARIEALAEPGGIYISHTAADQVRDKIAIRIESRGEQTVKNMARPIEVFCVTEGQELAAASHAGAATRPPRALSADKPSIAVLAFNNMSADAEQEYFSDGISEDIITDLSKLAELHVIARNSTFVYKGGAVSVPDVARELGVRYVLEGSVRKAGNRVRVTAQLIDSVSGGHVWADRFDRELTDIFAVQDELTREIVSALKPKLTVADRSRLAGKRAVDLEAYQFFLRGREQVWLHTRTGNIGARQLLGHAVAVHPGYAAAHAQIAFTHVIDYVNGWADDPDRSLRAGFEIAQRALEMDGEEPQAHFAVALACLWRRELDQALAAAGRCLALKPSSAEGHIVTAHIQIFRGEAAQAVDTIDAYIRLDPVYPDIVLHFLAEARVSLGEFAEAVAALEQRIERNPESATSHVLLASCYGHLGRTAESRAAWTAALRIDPTYSIERRRRVLPFKNPADFERRVDGLRKAGLSV